MGGGGRGEGKGWGGMKSHEHTPIDWKAKRPEEIKLFYIIDQNMYFHSEH